MNYRAQVAIGAIYKTYFFPSEQYFSYISKCHSTTRSKTLGSCLHYPCCKLLDNCNTALLYRLPIKTKNQQTVITELTQQLQKQGYEGKHPRHIAILLVSLSTLIYTSELVLCSIICVHSVTRHNISMYVPKKQKIAHGQGDSNINCGLVVCAFDFYRLS